LSENERSSSKTDSSASDTSCSDSDRSVLGAKISRNKGKGGKKGRNNILRRDVRDVYSDVCVPVIGHTYFYCEVSGSGRYKVMSVAEYTYKKRMHQCKTVPGKGDKLGFTCIGHDYDGDGLYRPVLPYDVLVEQEASPAVIGVGRQGDRDERSYVQALRGGALKTGRVMPLRDTEPVATTKVLPNTRLSPELVLLLPVGTPVGSTEEAEFSTTSRGAGADEIETSTPPDLTGADVPAAEDGSAGGCCGHCETAGSAGEEGPCRPPSSSDDPSPARPPAPPARPQALPDPFICT
jgi:hypothetical protein